MHWLCQGQKYERLLVNGTCAGSFLLTKNVNFRTLAAHAGKGIAGAARIGRRAGGIDMCTKAILGFGTAGNVRHAGIVGNVADLPANPGQKISLLGKSSKAQAQSILGFLPFE